MTRTGCWKGDAEGSRSVASGTGMRRTPIVAQSGLRVKDGGPTCLRAMVPMKAGSFVFHPAFGHHYDGAKDEPATVRIMGMGPVTTTQLEQQSAR